MKKSAGVTLTVVAAMGVAARAQQAGPCDAASFNPQACQRAVQKRGFCSQGSWVRSNFHYPYPYYYDAYQQYVAQGGVAAAFADEPCGHFLGHSVPRGGFGAHGAAGHHGGG